MNRSAKVVLIYWEFPQNFLHTSSDIFGAVIEGLLVFWYQITIANTVLVKMTTSWRGRARWWKSRRPKFRLVPEIQLDSYQTIQNTYKLNRRSKKRIAATL